MTTNIQLSRKLTSQLLHFSQISPEAEICGLISSKNNVAFRVYPIKNVADEPKNHFLLDAKQQISVLKKMRENNEVLFAVYHSHPNAPACPSALDLDMAMDENVLLFITSLNTKGILELRAFKMDKQNATEMTITL